MLFIRVCAQIYESMFCPWHICNWSFGLDIRLGPRMKPDWVIMKAELVGAFIIYMRYG